MLKNIRRKIRNLIRGKAKGGLVPGGTSIPPPRPWEHAVSLSEMKRMLGRNDTSKYTVQLDIYPPMSDEDIKNSTIQPDTEYKAEPIKIKEMRLPKLQLACDMGDSHDFSVLTVAKLTKGKGTTIDMTIVESVVIPTYGLNTVTISDEFHLERKRLMNKYNINE